MKINRNRARPIEEGDLTPMIDMTFQLIAFFMVLINFSQVERSEAIMLPDSTLAKPPDEQPKFRVLLNMKQTGSVLFAGSEFKNLDELKGALSREIRDAERRNVQKADITVIIRAHSRAKMGKVQELIGICQDVELESFSLRVNEKTRSG
ncbi:MAG: biopolymer transporter ExbD [Pirellulaceae bacterium]|jgi:biopolymer transport protein ExbD|nr:biopolymer transporter ExbD [Pirellulaceae bacterium]